MYVNGYRAVKTRIPAWPFLHKKETKEDNESYFGEIQMFIKTALGKIYTFLSKG